MVSSSLCLLIVLMFLSNFADCGSSKIIYERFNLIYKPVNKILLFPSAVINRVTSDKNNLEKYLIRGGKSIGKSPPKTLRQQRLQKVIIASKLLIRYI